MGDHRMKTAEFDQFSDEYNDMHKNNIRITGESPEYFAEYKIRLLHTFLEKSSFSLHNIIDFGSGIGNSVPYFRRYFPTCSLARADVSQKSLDLGRTRFPDFGTDLKINEARIPSADDTFDIAFSACVFHHIPHNEHVQWLSELRRVVRPGGMLTVFEHNPLNPLTRRAVNSCPFDANAHLIRAGEFSRRCRQAGWEFTNIRFHVFFPRPLAALRPLERRMNFIPFGAQYSVTAA
jgi:SAM-dependent methyltransferase